MSQPMTVTSIIGPWKGEALTTLQQRCRDAWDTPLEELSDLAVATFLNQQIAVAEMLIEARRRLHSEVRDDTENFDGQLVEAVLGAHK
ncbi:hypothetical protein [Pseudomonas sp. TE3610]